MVNFILSNDDEDDDNHDDEDDVDRGVARIFQRRGHTVSNNMVMAFSPRNIVSCFLKKGLQRGGHGHLRTPPCYALG